MGGGGACWTGGQPATSDKGERVHGRKRYASRAGPSGSRRGDDGGPFRGGGDLRTARRGESAGSDEAGHRADRPGLDRQAVHVGDRQDGRRRDAEAEDRRDGHGQLLGDREGDRGRHRLVGVRRDPRLQQGARARDGQLRHEHGLGRRAGDGHVSGRGPAAAAQLRRSAPLPVHDRAARHDATASRRRPRRSATASSRRPRRSRSPTALDNRIDHLRGDLRLAARAHRRADVRQQGEQDRHVLVASSARTRSAASTASRTPRGRSRTTRGRGSRTPTSSR